MLKRSILQVWPSCHQKEVAGFGDWLFVHVLHERSLVPNEWTESIAVGGEGFVRGIKERLGIRAKGRKGMRGESGFELRILDSSDPNNNKRHRDDPEPIFLIVLNYSSQYDILLQEGQRKKFSGKKIKGGLACAWTNRLRS
jgi:hypothetical protein